MKFLIGIKLYEYECNFFITSVNLKSFNFEYKNK